MRPPIYLTILMLCLPSCAELPQEGRAAAILDAAQPAATDHAAALTGTDIEAMRRSGLHLITIVRCWNQPCQAKEN